jgi:hypothetical protein
MLARLIVVAVVAFGSPACGLLERDLPESASGFISEYQPGPAYEALFPRYVEMCALSQFRTLEGSKGGIPGHGVLYLKGACRDSRSDAPQLRLCDATTGPEEGVGVTVNRWLENANWIAVPGRDFFFHGDLEPGEKLTRARFDRAVDRAIELDIFRGIELWHPPNEAPHASLREFIAKNSAVTDFAITFGRTVLCARVPVSEAMLGQVVDFLNDLNRQYATGNVEFHWSGYSDNCVHLVHNALAAAGIWEPKSVNAIKIRQFFNLAIPANEFLDLAERATQFPLEDFEKVWRDQAAHASLLEFDWLPGHYGALLTSMHVHADNELYDTAFRLFVLELPFHLGNTHRAEELFGDPRFVDLRKNLEWYRSRYAEIASAHAGDEARALAGDRKGPLRLRYDAYIREQRDATAAALARLGPSGP